jgi:Diadenosine tetraphosphate (Ap4A) hydrolase and other HIT family hydrolases
MSDPNCIFCKIADGKIKARVISQNNKAVAFLDAMPLSIGHTLVIPKSHYEKVQEMNREYSSAVFDLLRQVSSAVEKAVGVNASTIAIHNGREAGQEVPHVHVHVIPRNTDDGAGPIHSMFKKRPVSNPEEMDFLRDRIKRML